MYEECKQVTLRNVPHNFKIYDFKHALNNINTPP